LSSEKPLNSRGDYAGECIVKLLGFSVVHRDDESTPTFERHPYNDQAPLLYSLHWPVSGPWLHGRHELPFHS
jgi:hypothetical protein